MRDTAGTIHTSTPAITSTLHEFYSKLYDTEAEPELAEIDRFLDDTIKTHLPINMATHLGAPLLASAIHDCIQNASRHKAPGPNALPYEILKLAPHKWAKALELVFNYALFDQATLTPT